MGSDEIKIGDKTYSVEYSKEGVYYNLICKKEVEQEEIQDSIKIIMKPFPYYFVINEETFGKDSILYIKYLGDKAEVVLPHFKSFVNLYGPDLYRENKTLRKLIIPEGVIKI